MENPEEPTRREELAAWLISDDNQFFAKSYANRIWGYLTGTGLIEPIDDIRAGNPPTNPELMAYLTMLTIPVLSMMTEPIGEVRERATHRTESDHDHVV